MNKIKLINNIIDLHEIAAKSLPISAKHLLKQILIELGLGEDK